jgi:hypothetical protein
LIFLAQKTIADGQHFHIGAHETAKGIVGGVPALGNTPLHLRGTASRVSCA